MALDIKCWPHFVFLGFITEPSSTDQHGQLECRAPVFYHKEGDFQPD